MMADKDEKITHSQKGMHDLASSSFKTLIRLKEENDQEEFRMLMQTILPDVKGYIAHRLSDAVKMANLPSGKYKVDDFVDELYLMAYENLGEVEDEKHLHPWLFKKADELLRDAVVDAEFNAFYMEDIEKLSQSEWSLMQQEFSADADGDLMLLEEFDDPSYPHYEYQLADVFVTESPEEAWIEELQAEVGDTRIHQHINMVLNRLPAVMRSVYDLAVHEGFQPYEIARIKGISVYQVGVYLSKVRRSLRKSLEKRFPKKP